MTQTSRKSILITGCSSGIGLDAARTLSLRGWRVFASCRAQEDCARLRAEGLDSPRIDHADPDSIASGFDEVMQATGGTLDALFNNGAHAIPGAVEDLPRAALAANFESNLFGPHDLTLRAIKVMRRQGSGRIVNCSSVLGFTPMPWRGSYNATKFALEGLTDTLRVEMRGTGIHVSTIAPGPIDTPFRENARKMFERWIDWEASPRAGQYRDTLIPRLYGDAARDRFELPPSAVTRQLIHALESPRPRPRYFITLPTWFGEASRRFLPTRLRDALFARG